MDGKLTTNQKGAIAELAVAQTAVRLGIDVYRPVAEGGRCDLIFDVGTRLLRIQCKWACRYGDVLSVSPVSSRRVTGGGHLHRGYRHDEIDAIVAYSPDTDRCYF